MAQRQHTQEEIAVINMCIQKQHSLMEPGESIYETFPLSSIVVPGQPPALGTIFVHRPATVMMLNARSAAKKEG